MSDGAAAAEPAGFAHHPGRLSPAEQRALLREVESVLDDLRREIATFDGPAIVRSSSAGEAGSAWSGAFSSFEDVGPDELSTAVRGVWASAFTVHALERFEVTDTDPQDFSIAVLVQPQLKPDCGGTARCGPNGSVRVNVTTGPLVDLVGGWDAGQTAVVTANGVVQGEAAEELSLAVVPGLWSTSLQSAQLMVERGDAEKTQVRVRVEGG